MSKVISIVSVRSASGKEPALSELCENTIGERAILNRMCSSLISPENRRRFRAFPESYCREYGLSLEQIHAVTDLDVLALLRLGSSMPNIERLTSIYGLDVVTLCMEQTGKSREEATRMLSGH